MTKLEQNKINETIFFVLVGSFLAWSFFLAIIGSTELTFNPIGSLMRIGAVVLALRLIFWNKWTIIITAGFALGIAAVLLIDLFWITPRANYGALFPRPAAIENLLEPIRNTLSYVEGRRQLTPTYDGVLTWAITAALAVFVLIFGFLKFNFYLLLIAGIIIFAINLNFGSFFYTGSFYVFIFCIAAYLIKHLNARGLMGKRATTSFSLYAIPITAICLVIALAIPTPQEGTADNFRINFMERPFNAIGDMIDAAMHPTHFSLAQTGFGGGERRHLGGNVRPNDRRVMRVAAPQSRFPMYLAGAVFDEYTGNMWVNSFEGERETWYAQETRFFAEGMEFVLSGINLWVADDFFEFLEYADYLYYNQEEVLDPRIEAALRIVSDTVTSLIGPDGVVHYFINTTTGEQARFESLVVDGEVIDVNATLPRITVEEIIAQEFNNRWAHDGMTMETSENFLIEFAVSDIMLEHEFRSVNVFTTGNPIYFWYISEADTGFRHDEYGRIIILDDIENQMEFTIDVHGAVHSAEIMDRNSRIGVFSNTHSNAVNTGALAAASYRGVLRDAHYNLVNSDAGIVIINENFDIAQMIYDYLIPRADWIFETYTQLPDTLPSRVIDVAQSVTQYATNDYERASMLNEFLRTSFSYTLSPGNTPSDRDFVDFFLFDQQEGYCVHFATSFVVMARSLGLAARYVEGFFVTGFADEEGFVDVINRQGHAWAEVYFEGFGWKIFEPTPAGAVYTRGEDLPEPTTPSWMQGMDSSMWDDWDFDVMEGDEVQNMQTQLPGIGENAIYQNGSPPPVPPEPLSLEHVLMLAGAILLSVLLAIVGMRHLVAAIKLAKIKKMSTDQAAIAYFGMMLKQMERFNYIKKEEQTPLAFAKTINHIYDISGEKITMTDMVNMLYIAKYSEQNLQKEDLAIMQSVLTSMDQRLRDNIGFLRHAVYKLKLKA